MPPQLRQSLVKEILKDYYNLYYFFFNDIEQAIYAPDGFKSKILTNMDCRIYVPGAKILEGGNAVDYMYFI